MRILLVEDDPMISETIAGALRDESFAIDVVGNGNDALPAFRAQHYDVVLLDLGLPGRNGFSVLAELRQTGRRSPF